MKQRVGVRHFNENGTDDYNNKVESWDDPVQYWGRLEQTDATEVTVGRNTLLSNWDLMIEKRAVIGGRDLVEYSGQTFEVVGPPEEIIDINGRKTHIEAKLRHFEG